MTAFLDPSLFDRYLAGECTPAEITHVQEWIAAEPGRRALGAIPFQGAPERTEAAWERVSARLGRKPLARPKRLPSMVRGVVPRFWSPSRSGFLAIAGAMAMIFAVWKGNISRSSTTLHRFATSAAQVTTIRLEDGSRVTMAPQTTLLVAGDFGSRSREVTIVGEAYFDVNPAKRTPFVVHANGVQTRVLGTSFVVRRYPNDSSTRISVASGRVSVTGHAVGKGAPPVLVLSQGMIGTVTATSAVAQTGLDVMASATWVDGVLTFNDTPVAEVLTTLGHWHGVTFILEDSVLLRRHLSATFGYRNITEVIEALEGLLNVDVTFREDTVTLRPKVHPASVPPIPQRSE